MVVTPERTLESVLTTSVPFLKTFFLVVEKIFEWQNEKEMILLE